MAELVPAGAWDTHIHVFDPAKFPYVVPRSYTPKEAQMTEYPTSVTGCKNIVIVHASMQGSSPAALLDTLGKQGSVELGLRDYKLRGLATIDVNTITDAELDALHAAGVRGARLHEMSWEHGKQSCGSDIIVKVRGLASRLARLGWAIGIFCPVSAWAAMADLIRNEIDPRIKIIADHMGELVREKKVFVKISGSERLYHGFESGLENVKLIASAIIEAGPDQIVFGTDWPHTQLGVSGKGKDDEQRLNDIERFRDVDDTGHIRRLREWIPDEETWQKLWVKNPEKLFN
ncbi:hypothetical protein ZTR_08205 [Talaromyces verruculosus]|nr:hypothetical protein ZTR_08205 [Talaromyces verruculosus]